VLALPENQRVVVILRYFEQLTTPEIAARLGLPASTVRSHLSRAVERLRSELDRNAGGDRDRWVRCFVPLSPAIAVAPLAGTLLMANATKLAALASVTVLIGLGIWSFQKDTPAASPGTVAGPESAPVVLAAPEVTVETSDRVDGARSAVAPLAVEDSERGPVRGVLLDAESGEPLPWFALGIATGPAPDEPLVDAVPPTTERISTDAHGRFQSMRSYDMGGVHLLPLEDWDRFQFLLTMFGAPIPRLGLAFAHDTESDEWETVELESGPAFRIDCAQAETIGLGEFAAVLADSEHLMGGMRATTHVASEPVALARFLPLDEFVQRSKLNTLHLLSRDDLWAGWARVVVPPGLALDPVTIGLFPCGSLRVDVSAGREPPLEEALLAIWKGALDAAALEEREPLGEFMASNSFMRRSADEAPRPLAFSHRHLPIGSYTVRVRSNGCADHIEVIDLRQGEQRIDVLLARTREANGRIEGCVAPRSGRRPAVECIAWCQLSGEDVSHSQRNVDLEWTETDGRWSATFVFENLLEEEYRVWITMGMGVSRDVPAPSYEPRSLHVRPGGPVIEFESIEPPPAQELEVLAQDATTGEPLAAFQVMAFLPGTGKEPRPTDGKKGRALVELRGELDGGRMWVTAPGHAPVYTDLPTGPDADGTLRATVRLDPGWGAPLQVMILEGEERRPAPGVEILADDQVVATTDETGVAWLSLSARPTRLAIRAPGLVLESTSGSIEDSGLLEEEPRDPLRENFFFLMRREQ